MRMTKMCVMTLMTKMGECSVGVCGTTRAIWFAVGLRQGGTLRAGERSCIVGVGRSLRREGELESEKGGILKKGGEVNLKRNGWNWTI